MEVVKLKVVCEFHPWPMLGAANQKNSVLKSSTLNIYSINILRLIKSIQRTRISNSVYFNLLCVHATP